MSVEVRVVIGFQKGDARHRGAAADRVPDRRRHRGLPVPAGILRAELRAVRRGTLQGQVGPVPGTPRDVQAVRVRRQRGLLRVGPLGREGPPLRVQGGLCRGKVGWFA